MSILVNHDTRLITQGITGQAGFFHTIRCHDYGTNVVGGVNPRKAGTEIEGYPVFGSVREAIEKTGANTTMIFVPAPYAAQAIVEAADTGIKLIVAITEGIPVRDMLNVHHYLKGSESILVGPNCPGITTAEVAKVGIAPGFIHKKGKIGIVSRSGTLTYEAVYQTTHTGLGQTTAVGIGGDPVHGLNHIDVIRMFQDDPETEGIILIGEIGGNDEEEAAEYIKSNVSKPVTAFIAGASAPKGKRMGHAGAIISGSKGTAASKIKALENAGVFVAKTAADIGHMMCLALRERTGKCHCNNTDDCRY
ncbi:MAG TPA: succinate--CoA ligase subunit alpha [Prolixibacteraceae bacterium]|nr:succinate--CoA ligase subunit alpha [Prolixibacteraceae bacterium]